MLPTKYLKLSLLISVECNMEIEKVAKFSSYSIKSAGPRYSPQMDSDSPNIQSDSLFNSLSALRSDERELQKRSILIDRVVEEYKKFNSNKEKKHTRKLSHIESAFNNVLKDRFLKPGRNIEILKRKINKEVDSIFQLQEELRAREKVKEIERQNQIEDELRSLRDLRSALIDVLDYLNSREGQLIKNNLLFIYGSWGTGKTHSLCDYVKINKEKADIFFMLAHLMDEYNYSWSKLLKKNRVDKTLESLIKKLQKSGEKNQSRSLFIIDGVNESNRTYFKKLLRKLELLSKKYLNVGIVISCRAPYEKYFLNKKRKWVMYHHLGFANKAFDAQKSFFEYYKVPEPTIPFYEDDFLNPLFLSIFCKSVTGKTQNQRKKWLISISSGQRGMTKIFEDFVLNQTEKIEAEFNLSYKTCWNLLKDHSKGIAEKILQSQKRSISKDDATKVVQKFTNRSNQESTRILNSLILQGVLIEDYLYLNKEHVVRLPYERLSDHLLARILLKKYLDTKNELTVKRSFFSGNRLGDVFECKDYLRMYAEHGLATAVMIDYPSRIKKIFNNNDRELVYHLPKRKTLLAPASDAFLSGLAWRDPGNFTEQTSNILFSLLDCSDSDIRNNVFNSIINLTCKTNHPFKIKTFFDFLIKKSTPERDKLWSEYLRFSTKDSMINRTFDWVEKQDLNRIDIDAIDNMIYLFCLCLTTTNKDVRDRATKCLVLLGTKRPSTLLELTVTSLTFNDLYITERMVSASYGLLMNTVFFADRSTMVIYKKYAKDLKDSIFDTKKFRSPHILIYENSRQSIKIVNKKSKFLKQKDIRKINNKNKVFAPHARNIRKTDTEICDSALRMDFSNYTIGGIFEDRRNYDTEHPEYKKAMKRIKWRIKNIGFNEELIEIDESIEHLHSSSYEFNRFGQVERYGKKYSWIAYFELAGELRETASLKSFDYPRTSDIQIDPSFPSNASPPLPGLGQSTFFSEKYINQKEWMFSKKAPSLKKFRKIKFESKEWILLSGYVDIDSERDHRKAYACFNSFACKPEDSTFIRRKVNKSRNLHGIAPNEYTDHYTYAGEIPWSENYVYDLNKSKKPKRDLREILDDNRKVREIEPLIIKNIFAGANEEQVIVSPQYKYQHIPGFLVEMLSHEYGWESIHSNTNELGHVSFPSPALAKHGAMYYRNMESDLYTPDGTKATLRFSMDSPKHRHDFFYIRKDLLKKYLTETKQKIAFIICGEKDIFYNERVLDNEMKEQWSEVENSFGNFSILRI